MRNISLIVAFLALLTSINPAQAQDARINRDMVFRAKGGAGLFVTGNKHQNNDPVLADRNRKSDAGFAFGEGSIYAVVGRNNQKSEYLVGIKGGHFGSSDTDGVVPTDIKPRILDYKLSYGAASIGLLNREARIVRADISLDLGVAYRDFITYETMFMAQFDMDIEISLVKPFGIYFGLYGLGLEGKSERYRREIRGEAGLQLWQTFEDPFKLHFRHAKIGGFVGAKWERDRNTPVIYKEEQFFLGPKATLDFGVIQFVIECRVPGSSRTVIERVSFNTRKSKDGYRIIAPQAYLKITF